VPAAYSPPPPSFRSSQRSLGLRLSVGRRTVRSVYLGGNITRHDWRRSLVSGLGPQGVAPAFPPAHPAGAAATLWPVLSAAVLGRFDYVGPYSLSGESADDAEWNSENAPDGSEWVVSGPLYAPQRGPRVSHDPFAPPAGTTQPSLGPTGAGGATLSSQEVWWPLVRAARAVQTLVVQALRHTDLYFAWLDTPLAAGTLSEIGLVAAQGSILWIAGPQAFDELWLAYTLADQYSFRYPAPADAFHHLLQQALYNG
jgi:hypothetical protein